MRTNLVAILVAYAAADVADDHMQNASLACSAVAPFLPRSYWRGSPGRPATPACPRLSNATPTSSCRYLFIAGAHFSVTTALYALLSSSRNVANLCPMQPVCEGGRMAIAKPSRDAAQTDAWAAVASKPGGRFDNILKGYRTIWDRKGRALYMEKTPALNVVWAPFYFDFLRRLGVPASHISFMLLTRSPCHLKGGAPPLWSPLPVWGPWVDPEVVRRYGPDATPPPDGWSWAQRNVSGEVGWRFALERIAATLDRLNARGAHVVLVDYQAMVLDPQATSRALSELTPCLGAIDPEAKPQPIFGRWGGGTSARGTSLASFSRSLRNDTRDKAPPAHEYAVSSELRDVLGRLGYINTNKQ